MSIMECRIGDGDISFKLADELAANSGYYGSDIAFDRKDEIRMLFEAALLALFYIINKRSGRSRCYESYDELRMKFLNSDFFAKVDAAEQNKLLHFANFMIAAMLLHENPIHKMSRSIELVYRVSEFRTEKGYPTGGGMKPSTCRRKLIYELESLLEAEASQK
jgi:hypothetical protein